MLCSLSVEVNRRLYMMFIISLRKRSPGVGVYLVSACWGEVVQRRLAKRVGELRVVHRASQDQRTYRSGDGDERPLVRAGLPPVGRLTPDQIDHLLDAARRSTPHLGRLA